MYLSMQTVSLVLFVVVLSACAHASPPDEPTAKPSSSKDADGAVGKYGVFEITLTTDQKFANPFSDAKVQAEFTSPTGQRIAVEGFYYGQDQWRVRFSPAEHGQWRWQAKLTGPGGLSLAKSGTFLCKGVKGHGPLRLSKRNPYRMEYQDGRPFYPIGAQNGGYFNPGFDGPTPDGEWRNVPAKQWAEAFQGAVNLLRWQLGAGTVEGCALPLIPKDGPADRYDTELAGKLDDLVRLQKSHGFSHIFVLFQDLSLWGDVPTAFGGARQLEGYKSLKAENLPLQEQYIRYIVARYGCFADIWEIFNEDMWAPDDYLAHLAKVIRQADPYDHMIATSYPRPRADWCEIVTPHKYFRTPSNGVDVYLAKDIGKYKAHGKVVQYTEVGNKDWMSNYDPIKWRVAVWTAFMNESGMLFWNMSGRKTDPAKGKGRNSNTYLGPETRQAFRVLNEFTRDLPIDMRPFEVGESESHEKIRTYGLSNGDVTVMYLHHYSDYDKPYVPGRPLFIDLGPGKYRVKWIDPANGQAIPAEEVTVQGRVVSLRVPPVKIDAACRIDRLE